MEFDWDDDKAASNLEKHGVAFEIVYELDWDTAKARIDGRRPYGEVRLQALIHHPAEGHYFVVFTPRHGMNRIISIRRAGRREIAEWQ